MSSYVKIPQKKIIDKLILKNYKNSINPKNAIERVGYVSKDFVKDGEITDFNNTVFPGKKKFSSIKFMFDGEEKLNDDYKFFVKVALLRGVRSIELLNDDLSLLTKLQYYNHVVKYNSNIFTDKELKYKNSEKNKKTNKRFLNSYMKKKKIDKETFEKILQLSAESSYRNDSVSVRGKAMHFNMDGMVTTGDETGQISTSGVVALYTEDEPPNYKLVNLFRDEKLVDPPKIIQENPNLEPTNPPTVSEIAVEPTGETDDLVIEDLGEEENKGEVFEEDNKDDDEVTDKLETEIVKEQVEQPQQPVEQPKREALAGEELLSSDIDFSVLGNNVPYIDRLKFEFNNLSDARFKQFYENKMNSNDWKDVMNLNNDKKYQQLLKIAEQLDGLIVTYNSNEDLTLHLKVVWLMLMNQVENKMIETSALPQTQSTPTTILDRPVQQGKSLGVVIDVQDLGLNVNKLKQMLSEGKTMEPPVLERQEKFTGFSSDFITQFRQSVKDKKAQPQQKDKDTVTVKKDNMVVEKDKRRRRILVKKPWLLRDKHDMKIKREAKKENKPLGKLRIRKK